jgi:hypothetical protein
LSSRREQDIFKTKIALSKLRGWLAKQNQHAELARRAQSASGEIVLRELQSDLD